MGKILPGTPLNFGNPKQLIWIRTAAGDFPCIAETEINSSRVTVIVAENGVAHAFCDSSPQVVYTRGDRRSGRMLLPEEAPIIDIGPIWGVDIYQYVFDEIMVALRETGKAILKPFPSTSAYSYMGVVDVDEKGIPHAFVPIYTDYNNATRAFVLHGTTWLDLEFESGILPNFPSQCRMCNGHFWSFPTGTVSSFRPVAERGYTFDIQGIQGPEDVEFFDINFQTSTAQGSSLGIILGTLTMSGTTPTYPGGPSYPFYYQYEGSARNVTLAHYSTLPNVVNAGILNPPVEDDDYASAPIKHMTFSLTGGIILPGVLVVNGIEYNVVQIPYVGIVDWVSRAVWKTEEGGDETQPINTIRLQLRSSLYDDFVLETASLVGQTGRVTYAESTCVANYTLPMLTDIKAGRLILEQFNGTVYRRRGNENQDPTTSATANESYVTESGTHRTFLLTPEGEKPIDPSWQHSIYIPVTAIGYGQDTEVGQVLSMQFQPLSGMVDSYLNFDHPDKIFPATPGMFLGVPGTNFGKRTWREGSSFFGGIKSRLTRNTPRPDHAAALEAKLAPGAKVYGILYNNGKTKVAFGRNQRLSTIFKGVVTASDYSLMSLGATAAPQYRVGDTDFYRMTSGAHYHLGNLTFQVTEIVSDQILSGGFDFFGDYWHGKVAYRRFLNNYDFTTNTSVESWAGNVFLDGSLRNIYPTEAYNAAWIAHAGDSRPSQVIAEGTFDDTFASTRLVWEGDYIWKFRRYYDESGHWEGYADGDDKHPVEVPRWKLDASGSEVKCWFDGIDLLEPKEPRKEYGIYLDNVSDFSFDRREIIKNLEKNS